MYNVKIQKYIKRKFRIPSIQYSYYPETNHGQYFVTYLTFISIVLVEIMLYMELSIPSVFIVFHTMYFCNLTCHKTLLMTLKLFISIFLVTAQIM